MKPSSARTAPFLWMIAGLLVLDQATKALSGIFLHDAVSFGPLAFLPAENHGVIGGFLSDLPRVIGQVFFSVLGAFLAVFSAIGFYLMKHKRVPWLRRGGALLSAGLLGNVLDRAFRGAVVDFLGIRTGPDAWFVLNGADLFLLAGFALTVFALFRETGAIWFEKDARKRFIGDAAFLRHYVGVLIGATLVNFFVVGIFSAAFLADLPRPVLVDYLLGLVLLELCFAVLAVLLGALFAHRAAGPIHAFEAYVDKLLDSPRGEAPAERPVFRLRVADHFRSLEGIAERLRERLGR